MSRSPNPETAAGLLSFGWEIAEATLAGADSERRLVTHWFLTPEDAAVNVDDHFGSDERTLRFLGVVLPTLIGQLDARLAVVALPWGLESDAATLTVIGLGSGVPARLQTRTLDRVNAELVAPPFWRLGAATVRTPEALAAVATALPG